MWEYVLEKIYDKIIIYHLVTDQMIFDSVYVYNNCVTTR